MRNVYNLNESENIYIEIIENYDIYSIFKSTNFKYFNEKGDILDHSYCFNLTMIFMNYIDTSINNLSSIGFNINLIMNYSDNVLLDYCRQLSIENKDLTVGERKLLVNNIKSLCNPGCLFMGFDYDYNYSYCQCKLIEEKSMRNNKRIQNDNLLKNKKFMELEDTNFKYFSCINKISIKEYKINFGMFFLIFFIIFEIILFIIYFKNSKKINIKKLKDSLKLEETKIVIIKSSEDENEITEEFDEERKKNRELYKILCNYFKEKIIFFIIFNKDEFDTFIIKIIKLIIFISNYYFLCGLSLTDEYISRRRFIKTNEFEYVLTMEMHKIFFIIIYSYFMNIILFYILKQIKKNIEEVLDIKLNKSKIDYIILFKVIIGIFLIISLHFAYLFFNIIFFSIYPHSKNSFYVYLILSLFGYFIFKTDIIIIISFLRWISLFSKHYISELLFKLSICLAYIL